MVDVGRGDGAAVTLRWPAARIPPHQRLGNPLPPRSVRESLCELREPGEGPRPDQMPVSSPPRRRPAEPPYSERPATSAGGTLRTVCASQPQRHRRVRQRGDDTGNLAGATTKADQRGSLHQPLRGHWPRLAPRSVADLSAPRTGGVPPHTPPLLDVATWRPCGGRPAGTPVALSALLICVAAGGRRATSCPTPRQPPRAPCRTAGPRNKCGGVLRTGMGRRIRSRPLARVRASRPVTPAVYRERPTTPLLPLRHACPRVRRRRPRGMARPPTTATARQRVAALMSNGVASRVALRAPLPARFQASPMAPFPTETPPATDSVWETTPRRRPIP